MSIATKTFANRGLARAAIATAKNTWVPPVVTSIRPGPNHARMLAAIGPQEMATDAYELTNGRWAVIASHPNFVGETIEESDIKRPVELPVQAAQAAAKGAKSGVVAKPGAEQRKKDVG